MGWVRVVAALLLGIAAIVAITLVNAGVGMGPG